MKKILLLFVLIAFSCKKDDVKPDPGPTSCYCLDIYTMTSTNVYIKNNDIVSRNLSGYYLANNIGDTVSISGNVAPNANIILSHSLGDDVLISLLDPSKVFVDSREGDFYGDIYMVSVVASPTGSEEIKIKSGFNGSKDISGYTFTNKAGNIYTIPGGTSIAFRQEIIFNHTTLGFDISDSGEQIRFKNNLGSTIYLFGN